MSSSFELYNSYVVVIVPRELLATLMTYKLLFKTKLLTTDTRLTRPPNTKQWRLLRLASADYNIIHIVISTIIFCSVLTHTHIHGLLLFMEELPFIILLSLLAGIWLRAGGEKPCTYNTLRIKCGDNGRTCTIFFSGPSPEPRPRGAHALIRQLQWPSGACFHSAVTMW